MGNYNKYEISQDKSKFDAKPQTSSLDSSACIQLMYDKLTIYQQFLNVAIQVTDY